MRAEGRVRPLAVASVSTPSCFSSSLCPPTTSTTSAGPSGSSTAREPRRGGLPASSTRRSATCVGPTPIDGDVMVVSDHGGGSLDGVVNLNAWFEQEGYLAYMGRGGRAATSCGARLCIAVRAPAQAAASAAQRAEAAGAGAARAGLQAARIHRHRLVANASVLLRDLREHRASTCAAANNTGSSSPATSTRRCATRSPRRPSSSGVPRRADRCCRPSSRGPFHGTGHREIPDLIVEFARYAWLGKGNSHGPLDSIWDDDQDRAGQRPAYVGQSPPRGHRSRSSGPSAAERPSSTPRSRTSLPTSFTSSASRSLRPRGPPAPRGIDPELLDRAARIRRRRESKSARRALRRGRGRGRGPLALARLPRIATAWGQVVAVPARSVTDTRAFQN